MRVLLLTSLLCGACIGEHEDEPVGFAAVNVPGRGGPAQDIRGAVRSATFLEAPGCVPAKSIQVSIQVGGLGATLHLNLAYTEEGADGRFSGFRVPTSNNPYDVRGGLLVVETDDGQVFEGRVEGAEICENLDPCRPIGAAVEIFVDQAPTEIDLESVGPSDEWRELGTGTPLCEAGRR